MEGEFKTETMWFGLMRPVDPRVMMCEENGGERVDKYGRRNGMIYIYIYKM